MGGQTRNTEEGVKIGQMPYPPLVHEFHEGCPRPLRDPSRILCTAASIATLGRDTRRLICNSCYLEATFDPLPPQSDVPWGARFQVPRGWIFIEAKGERGALDGLTLTASRGGRKRRDATRTQRHRDRERGRERFMVIRNYRLAPRLVASLRNLFALH